VKVVAIYNNKGGEGKSTVTVGLTEFLAGCLGRRVLVVDLDAQASSSRALLGHDAATKIVSSQRSVADLFNRLRYCRATPSYVEDYWTCREGTDARGSALADVHVMVPDGDKQFDLEDTINPKKYRHVFREWLRPTLTDFDYVLVDLPGNLSRASTIAMNGLIMSDTVLIPVRPTSISLGGLPPTYKIIQYATEATDNGSPTVLGLLLNETDRRTEQYRRYFSKILAEVAKGRMPTVFKNVWPSSPSFAASTDASRQSRTLKERFGNNYDHARRVALEFDQECSRFPPGVSVARVKRTIWQQLGFVEAGAGNGSVDGVVEAAKHSRLPRSSSLAVRSEQSLRTRQRLWLSPLSSVKVYLTRFEVVVVPLASMNSNVSASLMVMMHCKFPSAKFSTQRFLSIMFQT
jgi:chromosome partitioning protein